MEVDCRKRQQCILIIQQICLQNKGDNWTIKMQLPTKNLLSRTIVITYEIVLPKKAVDLNIFDQLHGVFPEWSTVGAYLRSTHNVFPLQQNIFAFGKQQ
jgi:hypothetical protein